MNFVQSVTTCLKKSFTFSGRASRSEYWYFFLFQIILSIPVGFVDGTPQEISNHINRPLEFADIVTLLLIPANISVAVRRLHDINRSGWWWWILLTMIGAIFPLLYWSLQSGTDGNNDYGKKPK